MVYGLNERVKTLARPYCKADHLGNAGGGKLTFHFVAFIRTIKHLCPLLAPIVRPGVKGIQLGR